ncbi:hypothetical protein ACJRO7_029861 [Eucalyptus globulus]|uniref:Fungal lipase-type domain-containing protein n=1 Tax=Eucalyptus globulus TaxID=34317 RepID=A0ABD3JCF3_EUCGL
MTIPYRQLFNRDHTHHNKIFSFNDPILPSIASVRFACGGLTRRGSPSNGRLFTQNISSKNESSCIDPDLQSERANKNEIHRKSDWVSLLDPIDPLLRAELIRYGEMAQASYDAFDTDPFSKYCGSCPYKPSEFFRSLEFRRVDTKRPIISMPRANMLKIKFRGIFIIQKHADEDLSITVTGHSLGGALAILGAYDVSEMGTNIRQDGKIVPKCVFSFARPRVGNARFKKWVEELGLKVLRVLNVHERVPNVPGILFNENAPSILEKIYCYLHVGIELALNLENSCCLKDKGDLSIYHDMEGQKFEFTGRDVALVNKAIDFLKDKYLIPPKWKQLESKGLVRGQDGRWTQRER